MDVHEKKVDVCIAHGPLDKPPKFEIRTFSTMTSDLEDLKIWLKKYDVTTIGMESTGVYWKPIFNVMEGELKIVLANAQRLKAIPRKKTDIMDCKRIANLLRYGLLPNSFIPPREIRELRDLNRTRRKFVGIMTSEKNRLVKVLEAANIKLSSVVSKIYGVSSLALIRSLLEKNKLSREEISKMAKGKLKKKAWRIREPTQDCRLFNVGQTVEYPTINWCKPMALGMVYIIPGSISIFGLANHPF